MNICQAIQCPYSHEKNGCQRWSRSNFCHLKRSHQDWESNEYWLYTKETWSNEFRQLVKNENEAFFREDPTYQNDLEFQKEFPELFSETEKRFRLRPLNSEYLPGN
jgi:hypothetical protein